MTDNKNIKKGAPARNPVCYQTLQDIVIPAGTIFRDATVYRGQIKESCTHVNLSPGVDLYASIDNVPETATSPYFKKVIA